MAIGKTPITLQGNITADPETRFTAGGAAVTQFTVASTPRVYDKQSGEWKDSDPLFLRCSIWRQAAENAAETLRKGMAVIVVGELRQRSYEKDGQKRTVFEVEAENVGPSLLRATATVTKNGSTGQQPAQSGYGQQQPAHDPWNTSVPQQRQDEPPF